MSQPITLEDIFAIFPQSEQERQEYQRTSLNRRFGSSVYAQRKAIALYPAESKNLKYQAFKSVRIKLESK